MTKLTVTVTVYLDPDELPSGLVGRITRGIASVIGRERLVSCVSRVDLMDLAPLVPGDDTPI